ncbi:bis-aminopropyl spermidine synthase family protein [Pigmentibacter sp. JX0631]|uniref:bis-aminopropyl spermidine synthase family protein n=1 Tax=Pigmentibacter sp. JX0631 TaxID=2976982 RepID=UPI0024694C5C|nr:bis-aminopropyl spermidine synthase family protein [Pigmentibacter sp. JX0631]WGL58970.1 bis-aminopropyl spermidine synthase family protein [Pigmentibacter sp. JX0631]
MNLSKAFLFILSKVLIIFFKSRTIKHILNLSVDEKKEFLLKILNENQRFIDLEKEEYSDNNSLKFIQNYNQLPCTIETRKKRADLLEINGFRDKEVLLMGDDDLVSVELALRNFKHVTVLDCDKNLLSKLKILTSEAKFPINFFHIDLYHGIPNYLNKLFDVICFDPPQNSKDLDVFLHSTFQAIKYGNSSFYMMLNSSAIGEKELSTIIKLINNNGFFQHNKIEYFNCYPLNKGQSILLTFVSFFFKSIKKNKIYIKCRYYFTDCYEFKSHITNSVNQDNFDVKLPESNNSNKYIKDVSLPFFTISRS